MRELLLNTVILLVCWVGGSIGSAAQCTDWQAKATLAAGSTCVANGAFNVSLSGNDAANLSNLRYGIALTPSGFSVPLNSSPSFSGIPPGTYQVSVVAMCGGSYVGRNTSIAVPGAYVIPACNAGMGRASLSCGATGSLNASVSGGAPPYVYVLSSFPAGYTGPTSITSTARNVTFSNLPAGSYAVQAMDACLSGTAPRSVVIGSVNEAALPVVYRMPIAADCNTIIVYMPNVDERNTGFEGYAGDTSFKATAVISGLGSTSVLVRLVNGAVPFRLPAGKTLKDCYGKQVSFTIYMPCGLPVTRTMLIPTPDISMETEQHCNLDFDLTLGSVGGMICQPLQFTLRDLASGKLYGPYAASGGQAVAKGLPPGTYSVTMTTGDGYTTSKTLTVTPASGNPYSVTVIPGAGGLNGFAGGFSFTTSANAASTRKVELFSGPPGYYSSNYWYGSSTFNVTQNGTRTATTLLFPAGTYVWKITDDCGTYYLTVRVTAADLYRFAVDSVSQRRSCQGLVITPWLHSTRNGAAQPVTSFVLLRNGQPNYSPTGAWPIYASGTPVMLTTPGRYTILATSPGYTPDVLGRYYPVGGFTLGYPNMYNATLDVDYKDQALAVDVNATQGFLCKGAAAGSGQIYAAGKDGIPFRGGSSGVYYRYSLAMPGNGWSGPYIASNTTGIFTGFGGTANAAYDLKVADSCGAFAVQPLRILDLGTAGLISSSSYVGCRGGRIQLSAIYLPNATYSWTGPNGFVSNVREPLIDPLDASNIGVYRLAITSSECNGPITDTTILTLNAAPPKPAIAYACDPRPPVITVVNPGPGLTYKWDIGILTQSGNGPLFRHQPLRAGETPLTKEMEYIGSIAAVAIDSATGCTMHSDSLLFESEPYDTLRVEILSAHLDICQGDTTTLVASGYSGTPRIQWLRNGAAIPGATGRTLIVHQPGAYRVAVEAGICDKDTASAVTVRVVSQPAALLRASDTSICSGDTALLHTFYTPGYAYSWSVNGSSIPGAFDSSFGVTQSGLYRVTVSNGACIAQSAAIQVNVHAAPTLKFSPDTDQDICPGQTLIFRAAAQGSGISYSWIKDGVPIPGADSSSLPVGQPGVYGVILSTASCPSVRSPLVRVRLLAGFLRLPPDTTICSDAPFRIPLTIDTGFSRISWSTGSTGTGIEVQAAGTYWVLAENSCGSYSDTFRVGSIRDYLPAWPEDTTICNVSGLTLLRVPALLGSIRWSTGESGSSIKARRPGLYWVEGQSPCGLIRDTIDVRFCSPLIREPGIPSDTLCAGDCIRPVAAVDNYPVHFYWSFPGASPDTGWGIQPGTFCYSRPGVYEIRLRVNNPGGADSVTTYIVVAEKPKPRFRDTLLTSPYRSRVVLPACAAAAHLDWYRNDSLICRDCPELVLDAIYYYNRYKCVLRNASCPDSCSYALRVIDIPHEIWLPDAFTPNRDGRNDIFGIITDNPNVQVISFEVYNRWGQRVFLSNLNNSGWDGRFGGRDADMGTYHWQLRYRVLDRPDVTHYLKGDVLLVR